MDEQEKIIDVYKIRAVIGFVLGLIAILLTTAGWFVSIALPLFSLIFSVPGTLFAIKSRTPDSLQKVGEEGLAMSVLAISIVLVITGILIYTAVTTDIFPADNKI